MKLLPAVPVALLVACASPEPLRSLDVSATRVGGLETIVEAHLLTEGGEAITLPKLLLNNNGRALIHVGDPAESLDSDGIHASIATEGDEVLMEAWCVELGVEIWRCERRARIASFAPDAALPRRRCSEAPRLPAVAPSGD